MEAASSRWKFRDGASKFGSSSTAEQVAEGIDCKNLTVIVTGGAGGIGAETVRTLAKQGAEVVIAARSVQAAEAVKDSIEKDHPGARIRCMALDLASLDSVRAFAAEFSATKLPLNVLINNAGIMFCPFKLSQDGIEMQFATNHLGHFLLTNLLLDNMKETATKTGIEGRIINLSSVAHQQLGYKEGIRGLDKINDAKSYDSKSAYGQSKLANILHANLLSEKLKQEGANITVNSVHPGLIVTPLWRHAVFMKLLVRCLFATKWKTVSQGAATTCYVAIHPEVKGITGKYFVDCKIARPSKQATDSALATKLWDISETLVSNLAATTTISTDDEDCRSKSQLQQHITS